MSTEIHSMAVVHPKAFIDEGVKIGPFAVIGEHVKIGKDTVVGAGAHVKGYTEIGKSCQIFSYAVIGSPPQDLKYFGEKSHLIIGNENVIREFVTINPGTGEGAATRIGDKNLLMAYCHVAHDCQIGNENIFSNVVNFAGHVHVADKVVVGGLAAVHQFCRIGPYAIVGGCSKVVQDIPPFALCDGHPAKVRGVNYVGLKRRGVSPETIRALKQVFKVLFFSNHLLSTAREMIDEHLKRIPEINTLLDFVSASQRGICR